MRSMQISLQTHMGRQGCMVHTTCMAAEVQHLSILIGTTKYGAAAADTCTCMQH